MYKSSRRKITIGKKGYTENPESKENGFGDGKYRLGDLIKQKEYIFNYLYDFENSWGMSAKKWLAGFHWYEDVFNSEKLGIYSKNT